MSYEPADERLRYLGLPSTQHDFRIFGLDYYDEENILDDMKDEFTNRYNSLIILQVMLHPNGWNATTIPIFAEFTEWVYSNHDLVNMNYTDAYNYKHDLECLQLNKNSDTNYTLSFHDAFNPMKITWNEPGDWIVSYAHNQTRYNELNVSTSSDTIILNPGYEYTIRSVSPPIDTTNDPTHESDRDSPIPFKTVSVILLIIGIIIYSIFKASNKKK